MGRKTNVNAKGRSKTGRFLRIPYEVLKSPSYASLSPYAVKLLVDIAVQYNGRNNGDLVASISTLRNVGWNSSATLARCLQELMEAGMIQKTRQGGFNMGPSLYAVTWQNIDECTNRNGNPRHEAKPTAIPSGLWKRNQRVQNQAIKKRPLGSKNEADMFSN